MGDPTSQVETPQNHRQCSNPELDLPTPLPDTSKDSLKAETEDGQPSLELKDERTKEGTPETTFNVTIGTLNARSAELTSIFSKNTHDSTDSEAGETPHLSPEHFTRISPEKLRERRKQAIFEPDEITRVGGRLEEHRLLLLTGPPEVGLTTAALLVAGELVQRQRASEAALFRWPDGDLRIDPKMLLGEDPELRDKVILLTHAFEADNADLLRFAARLSETSVATYRDALARAGSFLLLTSPEPASESCQAFSRVDRVAEIPPPDPATFLEGFKELARRHLETAAVGRPQLAERLATLLTEQGAVLARKLRTFPRATRFIQRSLVDVLAGELGASEALARMDDLVHWLLTELASDLDTWCAVVALTLCSTGNLPRRVSWFRFDQLRRRLLTALRRQLRLHREPRELGTLCRGPAALERAGIEVLPAPYPEADGVRFRESSYPKRLWEVLDEDGREIAGLLAPILRQLAEGDDPYLRPISIRALGRLGRIDPGYVIDPLLHAFSRPTDRSPRDPSAAVPDSLADEAENPQDGSSEADEEIQRRLAVPLAHLDHENGARLGWLFQGILAAPDERYVQASLRRFQALLNAEDPQRAALAVVALRQMALVDPEMALAKLPQLATRRLRVQWEELERIGAKILKWEDRLRAKSYSREQQKAIDSLRELSHLLLALEIVDEESQPLLSALQYVLNGLFLSLPDPRLLLTRLLEWLKLEPETLGPVVAFTFLRPGGISSYLWGTSERRPGVSSDRSDASLLLRSILVGEEILPVCAGLLSEVFTACRTFPGPFGELLEEQLHQLLASWAREGCSNRRVRPVVVQLLARMFDAASPELSAFLLADVQQTEPGEGLRDLKTLATAALTDRPSAPRSPSSTAENTPEP